MKENKAEKTFVQSADSDDEGDAAKSDPLISKINPERWKPKHNHRLDKYGNPVPIKVEEKDAAFRTKLNLNKFREEAKDSGKGVSFISNCFDAGRRSWHLKADLDLEDNLSVWLVERGLPVGH